jgi:hypothetical protein
MAPHPPHVSLHRVLSCALVVGLLSAVALGVGTSSGGGTRPNSQGAGASVETTFAPDAAALGFLLGAPLGALVGALWGRGGVRGVVGFVLVALVCGFAGLLVAGLVGTQTRVSFNATSVEVNHGAPVPVLVAGAAVGTILGALAAWRFGRRSPLPAVT